MPSSRLETMWAVTQSQMFRVRSISQLTDRLSYARSRASRLRATAEVWDLALEELFATRPPDA